MTISEQRNYGHRGEQHLFFAHLWGFYSAVYKILKSRSFCLLHFLPVQLLFLRTVPKWGTLAMRCEMRIQISH